MKTSVPSTLRVMNKSLVLNIIREHEPISRAQIAKKASLTRASTSEIVHELLAEDLIYEAGIEDGSLGRKGILLKYNRSHGFTLGVDLGGSKISMGLFNFNGELLHQKTIPTFQVDDSQAFIQLLVESFKLFITENSLALEKCHAIGIASPGIIDYKQGIVVEGSPNLPAWHNLQLSKEIEMALGVHTVIENDVRAALIGEFWKGKCKNVESAALISIGTGIGSALLIDRQIIRGAGNAAGEIGYMLFNREHLLQDWQDKGCFESLVSGSGLIKKVKEQVVFSKEKLKTWNTAEKIFKSARTKDPLAVQLVQEMIDYLSIAIINLISTVNPEKIILTGGICRSADLFLEQVNKKVSKHTFSRNHVEVEITELFEKAALYGISILALSSVHPSIKFLNELKIL